MTTAPTADPEPKTILDQVGESFVPPELQAHYYKTLMYLRTLDPNDDLLRIVEAIGFFMYITRQAPMQMAAEREKLKALASEHVRRVEQAVQTTAGYHQKLESRLTNLPDEVVRGINPSTIAGRIGESVRQRFNETELPQTAQMLKATAAHMTASGAELTGALKMFSDPQNGAVSRFKSAVATMNSELMFAADYVKEQTAGLREEARQAIFLFCGVALFLGVMLGMVLQSRLHSCP